MDMILWRAFRTHKLSFRGYEAQPSTVKSFALGQTRPNPLAAVGLGIKGRNGTSPWLAHSASARSRFPFINSYDLRDFVPAKGPDNGLGNEFEVFPRWLVGSNKGYIGRQTEDEPLPSRLLDNADRWTCGSTGNGSGC